MIISKGNYPINKNYEIVKGYIKDVNTQGRGVTALIGEDEFKEQEKSIEHFAAKGLLKLTEKSHREESTQWLIGTTVRIWTTVSIDLTELGNKYLVQNNQKSFVVNLWVTDFKEITGIQELEKNKSSKVDYTISNNNITPFGEIFSDKNTVTQKSAYFSLYDDGWRIND